MKIGIASVTFRELGIKEILEYAKKAGLDLIEWGSDVHVKPEEKEQAAYVALKTGQSGLCVSSYGSYYRLGIYENYEKEFAKYLETAKILGAPIIRVWAGTFGSKEAGDKYFKNIVEETKSICDMAGNISIAFEFHGGTVCDSKESALRLVKEVGRVNFGLYFQFDPLVSLEENINTLNAFLPYLKVVHVFNIDKYNNRFSIGENGGEKIWHSFVRVLNKSEKDINMLFEFLQNPSLESLKKETEILKKIISSEKN
ncbi:MAG: TIM barrel protein [Clostridia bacterium]|nr:TIM barrel protein [Clostridia bacterium]